MNHLARRPALLLLAALILPIGMFACEQSTIDVTVIEQGDPLPQSGVVSDRVLARARRAGSLHTDFMRYVHEALRAEWLETRRPLTRSSTARVLKKACLDFYREHKLPISECSRADKISAGSARGTATVPGPTRTSEPYDQYLAAVEAAGSSASDLQAYLGMLAGIETAAISDQAMYSDTLDLELVLTVTSVAAESATYANSEVQTWGELYDPCHYMIVREEWCPPLVPPVSLARLSGPSAEGPQLLGAWGGAGWRILGADVGAAIGGGLWARVARAVIVEYAAASAAVASATQIALEIIELFD